MPTSLDAPPETTSVEAAIELRNVSVYYGRFEALRDVNLTIPNGATGLVGRNGAGKSTLIRLILGLIGPSKGDGQVLGVPIRSSARRLRHAVGYMPENDAFLPGMKAIEQVALAGELCSLPSREAIRRAHEVLSYVDLGEARYRNVEGFSTGMKQRLKLAVALVHDPVLLLLDEPTVGLDPPARKRMLDLIADLVQTHQKSLLISTHLLADIQHTCRHLVIVERGAVIAQGTMDQVLGVDSSRFLLQWEGAGSAFIDRVRAEGGSLWLRQAGGDGAGALTARGSDADTLPTDQQASDASTRNARAVVKMPENFDPRRFFHWAHECGVRLRELDLEYEDLGEIYHRLLAKEGRA